MKPIEAGCLALVIADPDHLDNVGKVVKVVESIPKNEKIHTFFINHDRKICATGDSSETLMEIDDRIQKETRLNGISSNIPMDLDCTTRDGLYEEKATYIVFDNEEIKAIITSLQSLVK